jgi:hypothetical protein
MRLGDREAITKLQTHARTAYKRGFDIGRASNALHYEQATSILAAERELRLEENARFTEMILELEAKIEALEDEIRSRPV